MIMVWETYLMIYEKRRKESETAITNSIESRVFIAIELTIERKLKITFKILKVLPPCVGGIEGKLSVVSPKVVFNMNVLLSFNPTIDKYTLASVALVGIGACLLVCRPSLLPLSVDCLSNSGLMK